MKHQTQLAIAIFAITLTFVAPQKSAGADPSFAAESPLEYAAATGVPPHLLITPQALLSFTVDVQVNDTLMRVEATPPQEASVAQEISFPFEAAMELASLSDNELDGYSAGETQVILDDFFITIDNNSADLFTMSIAQDAFGGAQGLFTTIQAVNSAINMTMIVNIWLTGPGGVQSGL